MSADALLWQRLAQADIVHGEAPGAPPPADAWYIAAMVGGAAWFAALFILAFLGIALHDVVDSPAAVMVLGLAVSGASVAVLMHWGDRVFINQLAFAFSLAGQALVLLGLWMPGSLEAPLAFWLFAAFEAMLIALVDHAGHRVMATFACATAVLAGLASVWAADWFLPLVLAGFVASEAVLLAGTRRHALWEAIALGLMLAALAGLVHGGVPDLWNEPRAPSGAAELFRVSAHVALVIVGAIAGCVLVRDAGASVASARGALAPIAIAAFMAVAWPVPSAAVALVMLLLAFAANQRVLIGLALVCLVAALVHHYYRMDTSLLDKSAGLMVAAVVLLGARAVVRNLMPATDGGRRA